MSKFGQWQNVPVEGLSHAATHEERRPGDTSKGLRQMWTARTNLPPDNELHSMRRTTQTSQELTLTQAVTSHLGCLVCSAPVHFN